MIWRIGATDFPAAFQHASIDSRPKRNVPIFRGDPLCLCSGNLLSALGISVGELVPAKQVGTMGLIIEPQGDSSFKNYNDYGIPLAEGKA